MTWRFASVVTYSMFVLGLVCQWMPVAPPVRALPPPTFICSVVTDSLFFSSSEYSATLRTTSPWNFSGQWHCSHTSRAGRRFCTGEAIGLE